MFGTDKAVETSQGITLDYGDFQIKIARAGGSNKKFARILTTRLKPYRRQMDTDTMDEGIAQKIMIETYADSVILGWTGVKDSEGNDMEFNRENVIKLFTDLPDLFMDVRSQSDKMALFRSMEIESDVKN
jgi:hypothetical protein